METEYLVKMANDIGNFFSSEPDSKVAAEGIANHIRSFWDPRMRKAIMSHFNAGGTGLADNVKSALSLLQS